jgi:putative sugar O-methyltransferase
MAGASAPSGRPRPTLWELARLARRAAWRGYRGLASRPYYRTLLPADTGVSFTGARDEALADYRLLEPRERSSKNARLVDLYSSAHWKRERPAVRAYVSSGLGAGFRRSRLLGRHMLGASRSPPHVFAYRIALETQGGPLSARLAHGPFESWVGRPYLEHALHGFRYARDTVEHLYYLARMLRHTEGGLPNSVLELGGGYGGLARLVQVLAPDTTYVDIDYPEALALAHVNLRMNFPDLRIVVHHDRGQTVTPGAINLVPMWLIDDLRCRPDLFISTLALSETSDTMRDLCSAADFFGCRRIFLLGSDDREFRSARQIQNAVTALFGADSIRSSPKPRCYEVVGTRPPTPAGAPA